MASPTNTGSAEPFGHRLVIVEGIMGSGKSTTMRFIAGKLQDSGLQVLPVHARTEPHPVRATDELEHWFEPWRDAMRGKFCTRCGCRVNEGLPKEESPLSVVR
jgi:hypothetical protein